MSNLLKLSFWFSLRPSALNEVGAYCLLVLFALVLEGAVLFRFFSKRKKSDPPLAHFLKKMYWQFLVMGLVGFLILFFNYEQAYFFGGYFWYLAWAGGLLVWTGFNIFYLKVKVPQNREEIEKRNRIKKYLA